MPTYDFRCSECGHTSDKFLKIADLDSSVDLPCPECGKLNFNRAYLSANHAFMSPESLGRNKAPSDFRNFLSAIKKAHPGSTIKDH